MKKYNLETSLIFKRAFIKLVYEKSNRNFQKKKTETFLLQVSANHFLFENEKDKYCQTIKQTHGFKYLLTALQRNLVQYK